MSVGEIIIILIAFLLLFLVPFIIYGFYSPVEEYWITTDISSVSFSCVDYRIDKNNFCIYLSKDNKNSFLGSFDDSDVVVVKYSEWYKIREIRSASLFERWFGNESN